MSKSSNQRSIYLDQETLDKIPTHCGDSLSSKIKYVVDFYLNFSNDITISKDDLRILHELKKWKKTESP